VDCLEVQTVSRLLNVSVLGGETTEELDGNRRVFAAEECSLSTLYPNCYVRYFQPHLPKQELTSVSVAPEIECSKLPWFRCSLR
jgi:hypothetical protein